MVFRVYQQIQLGVTSDLLTAFCKCNHSEFPELRKVEQELVTVVLMMRLSLDFFEPMKCV
jgi:hypothetical protein